MAHLLSRKARSGIAMPDLDLFGEQVQRRERLSHAGRPRVPLRIMISLLYLKHAFNESDEGVVERWRNAGATVSARARPEHPTNSASRRALHYDPDWQTRPLWLLAAGTGLAPLWGILREALRQAHSGPIQLLHLAREGDGHYLAAPLHALAAQHPQLHICMVTAAELPAALAELRLVSRQTQALLCGGPASVETFARRLYLLGLPRNQVLADVFLPRA